MVSSGATEKLCQLMMVPGMLAMFRVLPLWLKEAAPATTWGPVGKAQAEAAKQDAMASAVRRGRTKP